MTWYAHTLENLPQETWQTLSDHLENTAALAAAFAEPFGMSDWAKLCGLLHDAGKYTEAFQKRLLGERRRVDHSTEGGRIALKKYGSPMGKLLAYTILGHHGHLPDAGSEQGEGSLIKRLKDHPEPTSEFLTEHALPTAPAFPRFNKVNMGFQVAFFARMLYSCLVDADSLDTERFTNVEKARLRPAATREAERASLQYCAEALKMKLADVTRNAPVTWVNKQRASVLNACLAASALEPGLFSLTVPTGGGKTLASMTFALEHALGHHHRRVIYVAPFTSIIEQTAKVYRDVFGEAYVLEHHSAIDIPEDADRDDEPETSRVRRLITENWASPIVVTTAVQFFESLFASRKWRCRKLHNIAGSVIILDEAQTLPDELLLATLAALETLCNHYGCTALLCTATQPALDAYWTANCKPREIIQNRDELYTALKRTTVHMLGKLAVEDAAARLRQHPRALCIVSTRKRARELYQLLKDQPNVYHLSARMCAAHRTAVLEKIRAHLRAKEPCLVISTQLIEAGVDVDFAVVYRELGGIDAIAQAAGRCNREGRMEQPGEVFVYRPAEGLPRGFISQSAAIADSVLKQFDDPLSLDAVRSYSEKRFMVRGMDMLDNKKILKMLNSEEVTRYVNIPFDEVAKEYQLIEEDGGETIFVPYGDEGVKRVENLRAAVSRGDESLGKALKALQRYGVNLYAKEYAEIYENGWIEVVGGLYPVLSEALKEHYREDIGLEPVNPLVENAIAMV
ncbi:MAG: CRISPR-associated helicase Cas3' [Oscillospiraceae bacterium]|jgi:CRISPR-associated helicase Cas3/CRISPR-associated endonuclease Cas3-HD|nr:CRISPR-associated helicase Cas3' [Oscillospiraceae bacterium]